MCSSISSLSSPSKEKDDPHPSQNKLGLAFFACLQNALVGGIVFGWASIDKTMLQAPYEAGGAGLTPTQTTRLFSYASSTAMLASLFLGPLLDAGGPRACLVVSHLLVVLGCGGFALATEFWQFMLAVISMAFGGPGIGIAIIHVANLFPGNKFLAVSTLAGSITLCFSMLAVLEAIWENYQVGFRTLFGAYSLVAAISMIGTIVLSPDEPYELEEDDDDDNEGDGTEQEYNPSLEQEYVEATMHTYAHKHQQPLLLTDQSLTSTLRRETINDDGDCKPFSSQYQQSERSRGQFMQLDKRKSFFQSQEALQSGNEAALKLMSLKDQPFVVQLQSPTFLRAVLIFVITSFIANFIIACLTRELEDLGQFDAIQQHDLSQQFTWLLSLGMPYSVVVGRLMDQLGLEVCTLLTLILGQLTSLLMMIASLERFHDKGAYPTMLLGFACYSLFRQFLFPVFLAFITARFGFKYFGILTGIGFAISGVAQCFMAQLVEWVHEYNSKGGQGWLDFHVLQIVVMAALMVIPIADHRDIQKREASMERALEHSRRTGNKSPRSTTSSTATSATATTPLREESAGLNDVEYGSLLANQHN